MKIIIFSEDQRLSEIDMADAGLECTVTTSIAEIEQLLDPEFTILLIDYDSIDAQQLNNKYVDDPNIARIIVSENFTSEEFKKFQSGDNAADGCFKKPISSSLLNGIVEDFSLVRRLKSIDQRSISDELSFVSKKKELPEEESKEESMAKRTQEALKTEGTNLFEEADQNEIEIGFPDGTEDVAQNSLEEESTDSDGLRDIDLSTNDGENQVLEFSVGPVGEKGEISNEDLTDKTAVVNPAKSSESKVSEEMSMEIEFCGMDSDMQEEIQEEAVPELEVAVEVEEEIVEAAVEEAVPELEVAVEVEVEEEIVEAAVEEEVVEAAPVAEVSDPPKSENEEDHQDYDEPTTEFSLGDIMAQEFSFPHPGSDILEEEDSADKPEDELISNDSDAQDDSAADLSFRTGIIVSQEEDEKRDIDEGPEKVYERPLYTQDQSELVKLQTTIRHLREERDGFLKTINELSESKLLIDQDNLGFRAELDETKIELSILKKRYLEEVEELSGKLRRSEERTEVAEGKYKKLENKFEKLDMKVRTDFNRVRQREKELEDKLELVNMDTETLLQSRDSKIQELKRKIDSLEFNMENTILKEQRTKKANYRLEEKLNRIMKELKQSINAFENDMESGQDLQE